MCQGFVHTLERHERKPTNQRTSRTEGLAQTCRAIFHCRTGHRSLKSMTEELRDSELPTRGSASLFKVKHSGLQFSYDLCEARLCTRIRCSTSSDTSNAVVARFSQGSDEVSACWLHFHSALEKACVGPSRCPSATRSP